MQIYDTMTEPARQELYDFALFLLSREEYSKTERKSHFGALKDKISYIAPDFDEPVEDFAEYM